MTRTVRSCIAVLGPLVVSGLIGCQDTAPPSLSVTSVEVSGAPDAGSFSLLVTGRGFVAEDFVFDLQSGRGEANASLGLDVVGPSGESRAADRVEVLSPRRLQGFFSAPLAPGRYAIRVHASDTQGAGVLEDAFVVAGKPDPLGAQSDAGPTAEDAGAQDAASDDAGVEATPPDAGVLPRPFMENFAFRQTVTLTNGSGATAPRDTTFLIPVPHQSWVEAGRARADGRDLAVYFNGSRLQHAFDDVAMVGTNQLRIVARLPSDLPATGLADGATLDLYYGDASANVRTSTAPFELAETFAAPPAGWNLRWQSNCAYDRPSTTATANAGAYCARDEAGNPTRSTIASPLLSTARADWPANQMLEVSFHVFGAMATNVDLLYFATGADLNNFAQTTVRPAEEYVMGAPTDSVTFVETNGSNRSVVGWRLPAARDTWRRSVVRFRPEASAPSLHFRFISADGNHNAATEVVLDDVQVRIVLGPDLIGTLGPVETR